ncbi:MAG: TcdA/TcdB catalytic glycosyltransferase domain-containing protein [Flavobacteriales bacterium AspAUS03]
MNTVDEVERIITTKIQIKEIRYFLTGENLKNYDMELWLHGRLTFSFNNARYAIFKKFEGHYYDWDMLPEQSTKIFKNIRISTIDD